MKVYCYRHHINHRLTAGEAEQVIYALSAAYADELTNDSSDLLFAGEDAMTHIPCPLEVFRWSGDSEMYAEHTEQCVESRRSVRVDA
jgi:hypothetical protein